MTGNAETKNVMAVDSGELIDVRAEIARLNQQIEEAHSQLDMLDTPRVVGMYKNIPLTVAGRLEWLQEHLRARGGLRCF